MNLEIRINTDNDAFDPGSNTGVVMRAELMHLVEAAVDYYMASFNTTCESKVAQGGLQDGNGNTCGMVRAIGNESDHDLTN